MKTALALTFTTLLLSSNLAAQAHHRLDGKTGVNGPAAVAPATAAQVTIGTGSGQPGAAITVPVRFVPGADLQIRQLRMTVKFRGEKLAFEKVEHDVKGIDLRVEDYLPSRRDERGEFSILTLTASALPSGASENAIPAGKLGGITFRLDGDDPDSDGAFIDLFVSVEALEIGSSEPLPPGMVWTADATIYELAPIGGVMNMNCFFFSH
jgi:hypothetical protein